MKERGENPPRSIQLIIPHKIRMIPLERVEEQSFVRFGNVQVGKATFVRQVQLKRKETINITKKCLYREGNKSGDGSFTSVVAVRMVRPGNLVFIFM